MPNVVATMSRAGRSASKVTPSGAIGRPLAKTLPAGTDRAHRAKTNQAARRREYIRRNLVHGHDRHRAHRAGVVFLLIQNSNPPYARATASGISAAWGPVGRADHRVARSGAARAAGLTLIVHAVAALR